MRTLALALAAAVLGTGCIIHDDDDDVVPVGRGDAIVYWEFIRNAPAQPDGFVVYDASLEGTAEGACPESGVEAVRITSAAGTTDVFCQTWNPADGVSVQGIVIGNLREGSQTIRVRAYRGDFVVYDSSVAVDVIANAQVTTVASVEAVREPVELYAYLAFGAGPTDYVSCQEAGSPNIAFALYDSLGTLVDDGEVGCSNPLPAFVYGDLLDLDNYVVRMQGIAISGPAAGSVVFDSCGVGFDHFVPQVGANGVGVDLLTLPVPVCPGD